MFGKLCLLQVKLKHVILGNQSENVEKVYTEKTPKTIALQSFRDKSWRTERKSSFVLTKLAKRFCSARLLKVVSHKLKLVGVSVHDFLSRRTPLTPRESLINTFVYVL